MQPKDDTTDKRTAVEKSASSSGWLDLLRTGSDIPITNTPTEQQRVDYFALCMASHFATVATFVPTDVDRSVLCTLPFISIDRSPLIHSSLSLSFCIVAKSEVIVGPIQVSKYCEGSWKCSNKHWHGR